VTVRTDFDGPELGSLLRQRRQALGLSLRQLAKLCYLDTSTLSRYETGGRIPAHRAALLDRAYDAEGVVASAVLGAARRPWRPDLSEQPKRLHVHRWPAEHCGAVWMHVIPSTGNIGSRHLVRLQWGPWHRLLVLPSLIPQGAAAWTGKGVDSRHAVDLTCEMSPAAFAVFGLNDPPEGAIDIRAGWSQESPPPST